MAVSKKNKHKPGIKKMDMLSEVKLSYDLTAIGMCNNELSSFNKFAICCEFQDSAVLEDMEIAWAAEDYTDTQKAQEVVHTCLQDWLFAQGHANTQFRKELLTFVNKAVWLDVDELYKNEYLQTIKLDGRYTSGNAVLELDSLSKFSVVEVPIESDYAGLEKPSIPTPGVLSAEFKFPRLSADDRTWMTITPSEMLTMAKAIKAMHGNICCFGLGLGYFAFMAGLRDEVTSITIVENNQNVIDLFTKYLLPQFPCKDKIKIIKVNAFEYMQGLSDTLFDCIFVDIWHDANDIEDYVKSRKLLAQLKKTDVHYWIEQEMLARLQYSATLGMCERVMLKYAKDAAVKMPTWNSDFMHDWGMKYSASVKFTSKRDVLDFLSLTKIRKAVITQD